MAQVYTGQVIPLDQPPAPSTLNGAQEYNGDVVPLTDDEIAQHENNAKLEQEILASRKSTIPPPQMGPAPNSASLGSQVFSGVATQDALVSDGVNPDVFNTLSAAQAGGTDRLNDKQYIKDVQAKQQEAAQAAQAAEFQRKGNAIASSSLAQAGVPVLGKVPLLKDVPGLGQVASWPEDERNAVVNFGHSVARNFLGADDLLNNKVIAPMTGVPADSNYSGRFDQAHPDYTADNSYQAADQTTQKTGIGMGIGGGVGGAIGGAAAEALSSPLAGAAVKGTAGFLGNAIGYGMTQDPHTRPLLDSYIPGEQKKLDNTSPSFAGNMFNNETRNTVDGGITGAAIGGAAKAASIPLNIVKGVGSSVLHWKNFSHMEQEYTGQIADAALGLDESSSAAQRAAGYKRLSDYVNDPKNNTTNVDFNDPSIPKVQHERDTISVLKDFILHEDPSNSLKTQALLNQLEGLRASMVKGGKAPMLDTAVAQPQKHLDETLQTIQDTRGGDQAIAQTHDAMVKSGQDQIAAAQEPVDRTQATLQGNKNQTLDTIRKDQNFGPIITRAEQGPTIPNINEASQKLQDQTVSNFREAQGVDVKTRNDAYKAISDLNAPADMPGFQAAYDKVKSKLPPEIQNNIETLIKNSDGSYAYLNNVVRPQLSGKITDLYNNMQGDTARALRPVRDNITTDQIANLTEHGNERTIAAASNAQAENKAYVAKYNQGLGEDLLKNQKINRPDTQPLNWEEGGRAALMASLKDPNRPGSAEQLRGILDTPQGKNSGGLVDDILLHEGAKSLVSKIANQSGSLTDAQLKDFTGPLEGIMGNLSKPKQAQVQKLLDTIKTQGVNSDALKSQLADFQIAADEAKKQVYDGHLKDFFKSVGGNYEPQTSGFDTFDKIISKKGNESTVTDLLKRAGNDPVTQKGLEAVMAKKAAQEVADGGSLSPQTRRYGDMVFHDNPAVMEGVDQIAKQSSGLSKDIKARNAMSLPTDEPQSKMLGATRQMITWVFGVLNHKGAVLGGIAKNAINDNSSTGLARTAADTVMANSTDFGKIAKDLSKSQSGKLSPDMKKTLFRIFVQGGLNLDRSKDIDLQTQGALGQ